MRMLAGAPVFTKFHSYTDNPVATDAWTEVVDSMDQPASAVEIFSGSGSVVRIAVGAEGSEVEIPYKILPGGSSIMLPVSFAKGARVAVRAQDVAADAGVLVLNFFG